MKHKRNTVIQLAILTVLGGAVILTMLLPRFPGQRAAAPLVEISVILRESDSSLWSSARLGMDQAAGELGAELRVLTLARTNDGADQLAVVRREVSQQTDALVVVPADPEGLARALAGQDPGCPILTMESAVEGAVPAASPDNGALGRALAQAVIDDGAAGTVLLLNASPDSTGVTARAAGAQETLEAAGTAVRVRAVDLSAPSDALRDLLKQPDLTAVMVFEPALTEQAASLKQGLELDVPLYGVGVTASAAAWLERGVISAAGAWSDFAAGYLAVEGAVSLARGADYHMDQLPFFIVRGEELYEPEYQKLLFPVG